MHKTIVAVLGLWACGPQSVSDTDVAGSSVAAPRLSRIGVGVGHACALSADGHVACWGDNSVGQLGLDTTERTEGRVLVPNLENIIEVSAGFSNHTCALVDDGTMFCWGENADGQLGIGSIGTNPDPRLGPLRVSDLTGVVHIATGPENSCALRSDQTLWCWGVNDFGEAGVGAEERLVLSPAQVELPPVADMSLGGAFDVYHGCALLADGTVQCWGANVYGELGREDPEHSNVPLEVSGLTDVTAVVAGYGRNTGVISDGNVSCWGSNVNDVLGDGSGEDQISPVPVPELAGIQQLALGATHGCALVAGGSVQCWGSNSVGQLGDGTIESHAKPQPVPNLTGVDEIASAYWTIASVDGVLWQWGNNELSPSLVP